MRIFQAWGMTETSPVATYSRPREGEHDDGLLGRPGQAGPAAAVGGAAPVDDDGARGAVGRRVDRGDRGPRAVGGRGLLPRRVRRGEVRPRAGCAPATSRRSTRQAFVQITDRAKDVIKSGGEWISSVELENELMAHPDVVEAAVIAKPDERWAERPLCCVVLREGVATGRRRARRAPRAAGSRNGGCPTSSRSSTRSRRRASASSTRRCCAARLAEGALDGRVEVIVRTSGAALGKGVGRTRRQSATGVADRPSA